jgi:alanyl aminopeptidase
LPTQYELDLRIDPAAERFSGTMRIALTLAQPTKQFFLHGKHLAIHEASFTPDGGEAMSVDLVEVDESGVMAVRAPRPMRGKGVLAVRYDAPYNTALESTYVAKRGAERYVITQMEAIAARQSFPCFDEPSFKVPWRIAIAAPASEAVFANTRETLAQDLDDGWRRHEFATTEALPSYLIAYVVGPWDLVTWAPIAPSPPRAAPLALRGIAPKGQGPKMRYALENTASIVLALEDYFGLAYPFDKLDLVAAPDFAAGAMENAGLIIYRELLLTVDEHSPTRLRQGYFSTHTHELAHQWFGNYVTMPWWNDIWLNEAFATWMATKIGLALKPEYHDDRDQLDGALYVMAQDSLKSARRIAEPVSDWREIEAAFDGITYIKGGAVLSMIESFVGADAFRDAVRRYMQQHARGNAVAADLIDAIAEHSSDATGVRAVFASFLQQAGVPQLDMRLSCASGHAALQVRQSRFAPLGAQHDAKQSWHVPVCVRYGTQGATQRHCAMLPGDGRIELPGDRCPTFVMPNAGATGYYRFSLDGTAQNALGAHFDGLDALEQRVYADSIVAAFEAGRIELAEFAAAAAQQAASGTRAISLAPIESLQWIGTTLADEPEETAAVRAFMARAWRANWQRLGPVARESDDDEARLMRNALLAVMLLHARDPEVLARFGATGARALGLDGGTADLAGVDADVRSLTLGAAIRVRGLAAFAAVERLLRTSADQAERRILLGAMGMATTPELVQRVLDLSLTDAMQPSEMPNLYFPLFMSADARASARAWLAEHLDAVYARVPAPIQAIVPEFDAIGRCSTQEAEQLHARYGARAQKVEAGPRSLAQAVESIGLCAARRAHYADVDLVRAFGAP